MITVTNNGDETTTLTISFTRDTDMLLTFLDYVARRVYMPEVVADENLVSVPVPYEDLTKQEKLNVVNNDIKRYLKEQALEHRKAMLVSEAVDNAVIDPNVEL
jgi:hypothetical protein